MSSIVRRSKSLISGLVSSYSDTRSPIDRQDPDFSVYDPGPTQNQQNPINNLPTPPTPPNQSDTKNKERKPSTDPWILDVLDYILDRKLPHEPGAEDAITEKDLEIFKDDIVDELEDFLNGLMEDKIKEMRSSIIPKIGSLVDGTQAPIVEPTKPTSTSTVTPAPSVSPTVEPPKPARTPAEEKIEEMRARQRRVSEQIAARNIEQQRIEKELKDLQKQIDDKIRVEAALSASNVTGSRRASVDYLREVYREKKERLKTIVRSKYERSVEKLKTIRAYADVLRQKKAGVLSNQGIVRSLIGRSPLSQSTLLRTIQLGTIKATAETSSGQQPAVGASGSNPLERARSATSETSRKELFRILRDLAKPKSEGLISRFIKGLISSGPRLARMVGSMASGLGRFFAPAMSALATVAPFLARAALPLVSVAGSALAGWKLGSALYEKYSAEIVDGIEYVVKQANRIVDGAKAAYEWLVETVKNPGARLSEIKYKIKAWASSSPTISSIGNAVKNAPSKVVAAAKSAASSAASAASSAGKAVVDSVSTAASGAKSYVSDKLGRLFGTNHSRVDFEGLNPATRSSFEAMAAEYRESGGKKPLNIESARRSTEQQQKLYEQNPSIAAKPGRSLHERGMALDIDRATAGELESLGLLKKYGFQRNVRGEPWHLSHDGNLYGKPTSVVAKDAASKSSVAPQQPTAAPTTPSTAAPSSKKPSANTVPAQEKTVDTTSAPAPAEKPKVSAPPAPVAVPAPTKSASNSIPTFSYDDPTMFIMNTGILA